VIQLTLDEILSLPPETSPSFQAVRTTDTGMLMGVVMHDDCGWHALSFYVSRSDPRFYEALAKVYQ